MRYGFFVKLALGVGAIFGTYRFCHKQTAGFTCEKIRSDLSYDSRWEVATPPEELGSIRAALKQPFTYLGKGAQSYVFASEDGHYVLKFFRVAHISTPLWMRHLPFNKEKVAVREAKRAKDFESYKLAYEHLKEETGLLYIHLNKTTSLLPRTTLVDKIGIAHTIELDEMEFLLQKRARPFYPFLEEKMGNNDKEAVKVGLKSLLQVLHTRRACGLADKDPDLETNFGFLQEKPIQFDIGRFQRGGLEKRGENLRNEVIRITDDLKHWLEARDPSLASYLWEEIQNIPEDLYPERG